MSNCKILLVFLSGFAHLQSQLIKDFKYSIEKAEKKCENGQVSRGDIVVLSCQVDCSQSQDTQGKYIEFRKWSIDDTKFINMGKAPIDSRTCVSTHKESATAELSGLKLQACFLGTEDPTNDCKENLSFPIFKETCQEISKSDNNNHLGLKIGIPVAIFIPLAPLALGCWLWRKYKPQRWLKMSKDDNRGATNIGETAKRTIGREKTGVSRCNLF